jgi:uncharacterized protein YciI
MAEMSQHSSQPVFYVVFFETKYSSLDEVMRTAGDALAAHVRRSAELHDRGQLVMAGAFLDHPDKPVTTMGVLVSREAAQDWVDHDPFVANGMVSSWEIREWANMFA